MKLIPDGQEAAQEFSKGLTAAVEEFNRGLPAAVATIAITALICALCTTIAAVVGISSYARSSRERARSHSEAQSLSQQTRQQTFQQEADAKSLTANLQYLRMWYGNDKETIAQYWKQKILSAAAIWQAKIPEKDVKVIIIDHEMLWPIWDIVLTQARADKKLYDLLVSPYQKHFTAGEPINPVTRNDERRFVAKDLKDAIRNADMIVVPRYAYSKKEVFTIFMYADLRGPIGPPTVEPTCEMLNPMWICGFHIIGSVCGGKARYAIPSDSTVTLQARTYLLRDKVSEEHIEDMAWHTVEARLSRPSKESGSVIWRWFSFLAIVSIIVGTSQLFGAGTILLLVMAALYIIGKYQTEQKTRNNV